MKSRHFRRSKCLNSVALDISIDRQGFCDIVREILRRLSRDSDRGMEVLYAERRAHLDRARAGCGRTLLKKLSEIALTSLRPLLSQPVGNVQFTLYCDKH